MKSVFVRTLDVLGSPFVCLAGFLLAFIRRLGVDRLPACRKALSLAGVFPIRRHYYEPLFDTESLRDQLSSERDLPGVNLNVSGQLQLLGEFRFATELLEIPLQSGDPLKFYYHNSRFGPGDAELLYSMVGRFKPTRIVEIGSGFSTLMVRCALTRNKSDDSEYNCDHLCVEPYEEPWLEKCGATVLRDRVETVNKDLFRKLGKNDILFIDSSHMVRPGGDVLCEYLQILPLLNPGVLVHIHDIFTPRDYPAAWVCDEVRFWNEQYLLEAFLSHNKDFEILCALNYLKHNHFTAVSGCFPMLEKEPSREPGSFWLRRK